MKRLIILAVLLLFPLRIVSAQADSLPYRSYAYGNTGWPFYMQSPYVPVGILGQNLDAGDGSAPSIKAKGLNNPSDIFIAEDDSIYIADTGNARIAQLSEGGVLLKEYGLGVLKAPEGVFVDSKGVVYVADSGTGRLVIFEPSGALRIELGVPDDPRISGMMFTPIDISVDVRGYLYVLLKGNNEGLLIMTPEGSFQGFFARNNTQVSLEERLKRLIYTSEQIATNSNVVAASVSGLCIGRDGYVYTCTSTLKEGQIKKFNANGVDLLNNLDSRVIVNRRTSAMSAASAIFVDSDSVIYSIDGINGAVVVYDANAKPLFMFGEKLTGNERRIGFFSDPVSIAVTSKGMLMVLDRAYNGIHVFRPTELTVKILRAVSLYNDGRYLDAEGLWENILKNNSSYYLANQGLGRIAYMRGDWQHAMEQMKVALNQTHYSEALWKYRADVTQAHAGTVMAVLLALGIVHLILSRIFHLSLFKFLSHIKTLLHTRLIAPLYRAMPWLDRKMKELRYSLNVLRHPIDTFYETTRRPRGSIPTAIILFSMFLAAMVIQKALTNFVFDSQGLRGMTAVSAIVTFALPIMLWILGNVLVGAITKGQGTLRGIFISTAYALLPMTLFSPLLALLSNALTLAEGSIFSIGRSVLYLWTGFLLALQVKEIHGYEVGETIRNIIWILFVALMVVVAAAAVGGIFLQAFNFLNEFFRELLNYA